jgi:GTPase
MFRIVEVNDIHCKKISTKIAYQGQFSSLSLIKTDTFSGLKYEDIRKGMSLLDVNMSVPYACKSFLAEIWSLDGGTKTIKYKYEPVVTIKHVRQTCKLKKVLDFKMENKFDDDNEFENYKIRKRGGGDNRKNKQSKKIYIKYLL